jgi:hypothetical protein
MPVINVDAPQRHVRPPPASESSRRPSEAVLTLPPPVRRAYDRIREQKLSPRVQLANSAALNLATGNSDAADFIKGLAGGSTVDRSEEERLMRAAMSWSRERQSRAQAGLNVSGVDELLEQRRASWHRLLQPSAGAVIDGGGSPRHHLRSRGSALLASSAAHIPSPRALTGRAHPTTAPVGAPTARPRVPGPPPQQQLPLTRRRSSRKQAGPATTVDELVDVLPARDHIQPARMLMRRNIAARLDQLRAHPELQHDFQGRCAQAQRAKAEATAAQLANIEERHSSQHHVPYDDRRRVVAERRHEELTQHVMEPHAAALTVLPPGPTDGLALRRWEVLVVVPVAFQHLARSVLISRLLRARHSRPQLAVHCFDVRLPLEANMSKWRALRVIENACVRFAIARRIARKRHATGVIRCFLRVRSYMAILRSNMRSVRTQYVTCQRIIRRWHRRRRLRITSWRASWAAVEELMELDTMPSELSDGMLRWYHVIAGELLGELHRKVTHQYLQDVRKWRRGGGERAVLPKPVLRAVVRDREVEPLIHRARALLTDWVKQVDGGANAADLFAAVFKRRAPPRARASVRRSPNPLSTPQARPSGTSSVASQPLLTPASGPLSVYAPSHPVMRASSPPLALANAALRL